MQTLYFYTAVINFFIGVGIGTYFSFSNSFLIWFLLLASLGFIFWSRSKLLGIDIKGWLVFGLILLAFVVGIWRTEFYETQFGHSGLVEKVGQKIELEGVVVHEPEQREKTTNLYVKVNEDLLLVSTERYHDVSYGDKVKIDGVLKTPESFTTEFGRVFNYPGYLLAKGVEYQISFANVEAIENDLGNTFISKLLVFKSAFMTGLEGILPEPAVGLGEGLLLGVKQALGEELEEAFRKTGIIHIVVLSGYNVMLVVAFVMFVLGYFLSVRFRVIAGILAIISFALLVGLSATVVRASIMASLLLLAQATGRMYLALRGLFGAGFIMLLFNPYLLVYDVGFQLSFLATLGLILLAPIIEKVFTLIPNFAGMRMFLVATIATQIAVLPLLLYQIGQFSVVSVVVNVLVLPMVPIAMLLTFATGMLSLFSAKLALLISYPTYWSLSYINNLALWFADFSFSAYVVPTFSFYIVPIAYLVMGILVWYVYKIGKVSMGQSEIGENLLKINEEKKIEGNVADWVIEEEKESDEVDKKRTAPKAPSSEEDTPIFFR